MAWRVLDVGGMRWNVSVAAERRPQVAEWRLVLSFRATGTERRGFWAPFPLAASSRTQLFAQAERIPDERLRAVLADHLS